MASSSSSSSTTKHDVFLSFRGEDPCRTFTSHLYAALRRKSIDTFIDDEEIERGDEISPTLLAAIERSKISIIIFSKDYASSTWCLDELAEIIECKNKMQHIVLPVFYNIDPSDVRKQSGVYADAFVKHEEFSGVKVQKWRRALQEAGSLAGWDSSNTRLESELIEYIVEVVLQKLNSTASPQIPSGLVGADQQIAHLESLLHSESADVHSESRMPNLRLLKFHTPKHHYVSNSSKYPYKCNIIIPKDLECLPDRLRYLWWDHFPLNTLPSSFCVEMLVEIRLENSSIKKLWDGDQDVANLKILWLRGCQELVELPSLKKAAKPKEINLTLCRSLLHVPPYILSLESLLHLTLVLCTQLRCVQSDKPSKSIKGSICLGVLIWWSFQLLQRI